MGKKHRRENHNPGRRLVMFWALLMGVISSCMSAPAPIDHMTGKYNQKNIYLIYFN